MIKALIFDFDGLILDTESSELQAWQEVFTEHGHELKIGPLGRFRRPAAHLFRHVRANFNELNGAGGLIWITFGAQGAAPGSSTWFSSPADFAGDPGFLLSEAKTLWV